MQDHRLMGLATSGLAVMGLFVASSVGAAEPAPAASSPPVAGAPTGPAEAPSAQQPSPSAPADGAVGVPAESLDSPAAPADDGPPDDDAPGWLRSLDLSAHAGIGVRIDDPPVLDSSSRAGLLYGLGLDLFLSDKVSVGVHYEHLDLGEEGGDMWRTGTMRLTRDLNGLWLRLRAYPYRTDDLGVYVALAGGPSWQSADATGSAWYATTPGVSESFSCEGSDSVAIAMRGAIGVDGAPAPPVRLWTSVGLDTYRLTDAVLDGCAPGAGTATVFGLRAGLVYGIALQD